MANPAVLARYYMVGSSIPLDILVKKYPGVPSALLNALRQEAYQAWPDDIRLQLGRIDAGVEAYLKCGVKSGAD